MAKKEILFKLLAYSDAAGKYNPEAPLNGNEDNFYVDDDLSDDIPGRCQMDKDVVMSECGCLMVVADGMGGMNAGEVASDIAIATVKDYFAPGKISPKMAESSVERRRYLEQVIKDADRRVKTDAKENPEHEGMGSTIIIAWIVGNKVTISWCGDSRAYRFNPINGIEPLSTDHSYVQELVNRKVISYEDTFEHPQGNIVTRSLGDPNNPAKPDTREFELYNDDIILLCSDGLSGVLRDKKTKDHNGNYYPGDNIEDIIASHTDSLTECREALMSAAEKADWYDNVTVLLCKIESGLSNAPKRKEKKEGGDANIQNPAGRRSKIIIASVIIFAFLIGLCGTFYYLGVKRGEKPSNENIVVKSDSLTQDKIVEGEDIQKAEAEGKVVESETGKKGNAAPIKERTGKKDEKKASLKQTATVTPAQPAGHRNAAWKDVLLANLKVYTQPALSRVVAATRTMIESASDDDQAKCQMSFNEVVKRAKFLKKLQDYNGKLTNRGVPVFNTLLAEIQDPNTYTPEIWDLKIQELDNYIISEAQPDKEISPVEDEEDGGSNDAPDII